MVKVFLNVRQSSLHLILVWAPSEYRSYMGYVGTKTNPFQKL